MLQKGGMAITILVAPMSLDYSYIYTYSKSGNQMATNVYTE